MTRGTSRHCRRRHRQSHRPDQRESRRLIACLICFHLLKHLSDWGTKKNEWMSQQTPYFSPFFFRFFLYNRNRFESRREIVKRRLTTLDSLFQLLSFSPCSIHAQAGRQRSNTIEIKLGHALCCVAYNTAISFIRKNKIPFSNHRSGTETETHTR